MPGTTKGSSKPAARAKRAASAKSAAEGKRSKPAAGSSPAQTRWDRMSGQERDAWKAKMAAGRRKAKRTTSPATRAKISRSDRRAWSKLTKAEREARRAAMRAGHARAKRERENTLTGRSTLDRATRAAAVRERENAIERGDVIELEIPTADLERALDARSRAAFRIDVVFTDDDGRVAGMSAEGAVDFARIRRVEIRTWRAGILRQVANARPELLASTSAPTIIGAEPPAKKARGREAR